MYKIEGHHWADDYDIPSTAQESPCGRYSVILVKGRQTWCGSALFLVGRTDTGGKLGVIQVANPCSQSTGKPDAHVWMTITYANKGRMGTMIKRDTHGLRQAIFDILGEWLAPEAVVLEAHWNPAFG